MLRKLLGFVPVLAFAFVFFVVSRPIVASAQLVNRTVEPVVLTGAQLPTWSGPADDIVCMPYPSGALTGARDAHNGVPIAPPGIGVPVGEIAAYRWDDTTLQFVEIPVQVDEMFYYCLSNPSSDFGIYSGTDRELTYAWDNETWRKIAGTCTAEYPPGLEAPTPDPVPTLDNNDEIVFMASDAGGVAPPGAPWPAGATDSQIVKLTDPLDPASLRFVYLFRKPGGSSFDESNGYVSYVRDANADEWIDKDSIRRDDPEILGVSNGGYGPNLAGPVCRTSTWPSAPGCATGTPCPDGDVRNTDDRFPRDGITVSTDAYQWRATGRWMVRDIHVAKPGQPGVYGPDLIDRWKGRAFQQSPDSSISLVGFEDEQVNWEANGSLLGERMGAVRAIREIWGADSGTNVTKTESFYRDAITYRYHVRVHPIPPDGLYTSWDYNAAAAGTYYNIIKPDGVAIDGVNDDVGSIDEGPTGPAFFDAPDPTFNAPSALLNWEEVSGFGDNGSIVYIIELKGATTLVNPAVVPYYRDDSCLDDGTGDDPIRRPYPGEATFDSRVLAGYCVANGFEPGCNVCQGAAGGGAACDVDCADGQTQGAYGAHGVHYFVTGDTDNAASPLTLTEIDSQQWQFAVPTSEPTNVGQQYGNVVIAPLQKTALNDTGLLGIAPPAAGDVSTSTPAEQSVDVTLTGLDVDSCELTFLIVTPPTHGMLGSISNSACTPGLPDSDAATVTYTPAAGYVGNDSFTYTVSDGLLTSLPATVTIDVRNERPIADHVSASTNHDTPVEVVLQAADEEECDVTFAIVDPPAHGMLSSVSDDACEPGEPLNFDTARVTYTPDPGFAGDDVFTYEVNDGFQDSTPPARATVTVVPAATAPVAAAVSTTANPGVATSVQLSASDAEQCELTFTIVTPPSGGTLGAIANAPCTAGAPNADHATVSYTADADFSGTDTFTYKANDGQFDSAPATVTITVAAPPLCSQGPLADCRGLEGSGANSVIQLKNDPAERGDYLRWKWTNGTPLPKADFGDPTVATRYTLCVFDGNGDAVGGIDAPADGNCSDRSCWKPTPRGFRLRARTEGQQGKSSLLVSLAEGAENRPPKLQVRSKGPATALGTFGSGIAQPVTVQLTTNDQCWEAVFDAPATRNAGDKFKDVAP